MGVNIVRLILWHKKSNLKNVNIHIDRIKQFFKVNWHNCVLSSLHMVMMIVILYVYVMKVPPLTLYDHKRRTGFYCSYLYITSDLTRYLTPSLTGFPSCQFSCLNARTDPCVGLTALSKLIKPVSPPSLGLFKYNMNVYLLSLPSSFSSYTVWSWCGAKFWLE